jgi:hypothetical protein
VVAALQKVGGGQAGHTSADNGDVQVGLHHRLRRYLRPAGQGSALCRDRFITTLKHLHLPRQL